MIKLTQVLQPHPNPAFNRQWKLTQLGVLLLPFSTALGCLLFVLPAIAVWIKNPKQLLKPLINRVFLLLGAWMAIVTLFAHDRTAALIGLIHFLPFFAVFIAQSHLIQLPSQLRQIIWLVVLTSIPVAIIGFGEMFWGWSGKVEILWILVDFTVRKGGDPIGRMASIFSIATVLASYLTVTFILSLGLWIDALSRGHQKLQSRMHWWLLMLVLINGIALILTGSRNAWGIALLACGSFAVYVGWRWILGIAAGIITLVLGAALAPPPLRDWLRAIVPSFFWARIISESTSNTQYELMRTTQWQFAWQMAQQRPLTGWGLRNFPVVYSEQLHFPIGHPHNLPLMLMAETGFPAALVFLGAIGWVLARSVLWLQQTDHEVAPSNRTVFFTVLVSFFGCVSFCLFDIPLFDARINAMNWLLVAGLLGVASTLDSSKIVVQREERSPPISGLDR